MVWLTVLVAAVLAGQVECRKTVVDRAFRSEGVAAGDVNRDGRTDVLVSNKKGVHLTIQQ